MKKKKLQVEGLQEKQDDKTLRRDYPTFGKGFQFIPEGHEMDAMLKARRGNQ